MSKKPLRASGRSSNVRGLSLEKLVAFATEEQLVDDVRVEGEQVVIRQGNDVFRIPRRLAATFLVGMLRGRSWFLEDDAEELAAEAAGEEPEADAPDDTPDEAAEEEQPDEVEGEDEGEAVGIVRTLDALLAFTIDVGLILSYEKHPERREVLIQIPACEASLSYADAVNFLFDCVQDHLQIGRGRRA